MSCVRRLSSADALSSVPRILQGHRGLMQGRGCRGGGIAGSQAWTTEALHFCQLAALITISAESAKVYPHVGSLRAAWDHGSRQELSARQA